MTKYPLAWPAGWKRLSSHQRIHAMFHGNERVQSSQPGGNSWTRKRELTIAEATSRVLSQLRTFGVPDGDSIISTNLLLRLDGLPRGVQRDPDDPGVAVYWQRDRTEVMKCMAIDIYDRVADNLAAVAATLAAMRAIERHGGALILERAFQGFDALPAPGQTQALGWQQVLELNGEQTLAKAKENYRRLSAIRHPDRGGSHDAMTELNWAWAQAQEAFK